MTTKVMVSFPEEFLAQVDAIAKVEHRSRSELVREALRQYMESRQYTVRSDNSLQVQNVTGSMNTLAHGMPSINEDDIEDVSL